MGSLSIIIPVFNSQDCIKELYGRLIHTFGSQLKQDVFLEIILINDCSADMSWDIIKNLSAMDSRVIGINLRKNVGQDSAIMAGMSVAKGKVIVIMDDDLQHSPEDIPKLIEPIENNFADVCFAKFDKKKQAWWKNAGSWFNGIIGVIVLGKPKTLYMSPFKALSFSVAQDVLKYNGPYPYIDGLILTVTSRFIEIPVQHQPRFAGKSNYSLMKSIQVWLKLATSFSVVPLRIFTFLGAIVAFLAFALGVTFLYLYFVLDRNVEGWTSLITSIYFIGGVQLIGIGLLGEYVGRTYIRVNNRPQFSIAEKLN